MQVPQCTYIKLKSDNWGTEITSMNYVSIENIKCTDSIFADGISHLRSIHLYDSLDLEGEGKKFEHDIFKELPPINTVTPVQKGKKRKEKITPTHTE